MAIIVDPITIMAGHGHAAIGGLPVDAIFDPTGEAIHVQASFRTASAGTGVTAVDGGLLYDRGGILLVSKSELADVPATAQKENAHIKLTMADATLREFEITFVGGSENPTATEAWFSIGPINR